MATKNEVTSDIFKLIKKINLLSEKIIKDYIIKKWTPKQEFTDSWSRNKLISIKNSLKPAETVMKEFFGIKK